MAAKSKASARMRLAATATVTADGFKARLLLQVPREEGRGPGPGVLGRGLAISLPGVVDVGEGVRRALVDLEVRRLARRLQGGLERAHVIGRGPLVVAAVVAQDGGLDPRDGRGIGRGS